MAQSQKEASSPVKSKKKNSLLDLDFGKDDFLSSWKSMSITEDDTMDLDFRPVSSGKKKAFNFAKVDMDFNLDGDFGKIPSFNLDMPDIDISSPLKKDGKPKERSNEESASGNTQGKSDRFDFTFDFGELDGFNFKSSSKKENSKVNKDEDKEDASNGRVSQKSGDCPADGVNAHEGGVSKNLPSSGLQITSKLDSQVGDGDNPDSANENHLSISATNDEGHLNSTGAVHEGASCEKMPLLEKTTSTEQELDCRPDKSLSAEPGSRELCVADKSIQDKSVHTVSRNESSRDNVLKLQEEVSSGDTRVCNLIRKNSPNEKLIADSGSDFENPASNDSSVWHDTMSREDNGGSQDWTENCALVANKVGVEPARGGSHVERLLLANASRDSVPNKQTNVKNQEAMELSTSQLNRRSTVNNLMTEKERETVMRSKYFTPPDKTVSRIQNASNESKLSLIGDGALGTRQPCPPNERNCKSIEAQSDGTLSGISTSHSGALNGKEHLHIRIQESCKGVHTNSPLDHDVIKGKPASLGGDKHVKSLDSFSLHVTSSSLSGLANKSTSQNCANLASVAMNTETSQTRKNSAAAGDKVSSVKATKQTPTLSSLTISRTSGGKIDSSKSVHQKDITLSRDLQQVAGSRPSKTVKVVDTQTQTLPAPSLKRKIVEASNGDAISKPSKRLSESPGNGNSAESTRHVADKEACDNENVVDGMGMSIHKNQHSKLDAAKEVYTKELEVPFSVENGNNIGKAETCSKELEDICNMLRKKHEEAKEILVRAIVNNNKLLMLNHPIYEEKIRMVQKFAMQLTLREIHTQT